MHISTLFATLMCMNIKTAIQEILANGITQSDLAAMVGCESPTIHNLIYDKQKHTRAELGIAILEVHAKLMRKVARDKRKNALHS